MPNNSCAKKFGLQYLPETNPITVDIKRINIHLVFLKGHFF